MNYKKKKKKHISQYTLDSSKSDPQPETSSDWGLDQTALLLMFVLPSLYCILRDDHHISKQQRA